MVMSRDGELISVDMVGVLGATPNIMLSDKQIELLKSESLKGTYSAMSYANCASYTGYSAVTN